MTLEWTIFAILIGISTAAAVGNRLKRILTRRKLLQLADRQRWTYSGADRFDLARRLTRLLPIPAPADIQVKDILYRQDGPRATYIATVDYTVGGARGLRRRRQIVRINEQRSDGPLSCKLLVMRNSRLASYIAEIEPVQPPAA